MKKAYLILSLLAVSLIAGCGGPNYANGFKEWLAMDLAKRLPVKLAWVKIEKLSSGKTQAIFKFTSEIQFTENLYGPATPVDTAPATAALQKMKEANVPIPQQNEVIMIYNSITILSLFKITTAEGKRIPMSGKAQATLQNNGEWQYELLDVVGGNYEGGKEPNGKWALEGSKEAKENAAAVQEKVGAVVAAADKAIQEARDAQIAEQNRQSEEKKKQEQDNQAVKEQLVALCSPGSQLVGRWQGSVASGDIGMRFGAQTEVGEDVAITGVIFDPAITQNRKPFNARITKSDDPKAPFVLIVNLTRGNGMKDSGRGWDDPTIRNKTAGFLLDGCGYDILFTIMPKGLSGIIHYGDRVINGENIRLQFNKGYTPIGNAEGGSSGITPTQQSTDTAPVTPTDAPAGSAPSGNMLLPDLGELQQAPQGGAVSNHQMQAADAELNSTYQTVRARLNSTQKEQLKTLQRDWLRQRDAAMAANPMNATAINYQATVARTSQLKELIQQAGGQQSMPTGGKSGKYRMALEEIAAQVAASKPLVDAYGAAVQRMDNQACRRCLNELVAKYPQCPMTLFVQMCDAFMTNDITKGQKIYTILMTEYPDFQGMRAAFKLSYEGLTRTVNSGPK